MLAKKMILNYAISVLSALKAIHVGTLTLKVKATIKLGLMVSPFALLWDKIMKWGLDNETYIFVVLGAIIVDHVLGTIKHAFIDRDFTWKQNVSGFFVKLALVVGCGFLFEGLQALIVKESIITDYLEITTRLIVFLYPAGSAFGNSSIISGGKFPPQSWLDKLKKFQTNLNPESLNKDKK